MICQSKLYGSAFTAMFARRNHRKQHETRMLVILVLLPSFYCIPNSHTEWQTHLELPKQAPCFCGAFSNVACSNRSHLIGVHLDQVYDFSGHKRHVANEILFSFMLHKTRGLSSQLAMSINKHWHEVFALASSVSHTA